MSGKRQHFLPQFLQRGFLGDTKKIWVFPKGRSAFRVNTSKIGVEGYFYTSETDTIVDDSITDFESKISGFIDDLRNQGGGILESADLPKIITHFETRTRHLRETFLSAGNFLMNRIVNFVTDQERFIPFLKKEIELNPQLILKKLQESGINDELIRIFEPQIQKMMPLIFDMIRPNFEALVRQFQIELTSKMKEAAKEGHLNVLSESLFPAIRAEKYTRLKFSLIEVVDSNLILGDSIVLFEVANDYRRFRPFLDKGKQLNSVYLPISSSRLLVGHHSDNRPAIDVDSINRGIVRNSWEFFLSAVNSNETLRLSEEIGKDAAPLTEGELEEILRDLIQKQ